METQALVSGESSAPAGTHNPVRGFLEIATSDPIMAGREDTEAVDNQTLGIFMPYRYSRRLWAALLAEFIGMAIFQIYGGSANDEVAAFGNGLTLAVVIYATANVSGGHVNPAVTLANCLTGHTSWGRGGLYMLAQLLGAIFGALIEARPTHCKSLNYADTVGGGVGPGCFTHLKGTATTRGQLWWWETIMTFLLVSVVFATAVTKPGHGNIAPLAIGFTLFASAFVGGPSTGAALNPARVLGPAMVFHCYWDTAFVYVFAEFFGAVTAAALVLPLYGFGQFGSLFDTRIFKAIGLSVPKHLAQHHQPELPSSYMYTGPITHTTPGAVMATLQSVKAPNPLLPIQNPSIPLSRVPGRKAPEAPDAAAHLVVDFNAPQPPPRRSKPSLAALAKAERERPHPRYYQSSLDWQVY
ncbi:g3278 [Coccomyxa viridis]|uniref:G3278 protein n=1 Tax=Coccomyxa viridis TaxID=1274662 RepID=A0ABP1FP13_9CHLO